MKRKQVTCRCPVYSFPHRQGSGKCELPDTCEFYGEACLTCPEDGHCYAEQRYWEANFDYERYDLRSEALTPQERNSDFRSW